MHPRPLLALGLVLGLCCACSLDRAGDAPTAPVCWPFDDAPAGRAPAGWTFRNTGAGGDAGWEVAADAGAQSAPQVLRMTHARSPGGTFNLALLEEATFADVRVSVKVRADRGDEDQGGGVVWRLRGADDYYVCRLNPLEGNFRVYKVVDGLRTQLASADVDADTGRWYAVGAEMVGDEIACFVDGRALLQVRDATFREPGRVGLWTKADAASSFDDFCATPLAGR